LRIIVNGLQSQKLDCFAPLAMTAATDAVGQRLVIAALKHKD
jgi:hypothetical protein